ncbi:TPR (repeat) domain protein [Legionella lansingensis]|uniref:VWFA domain-containing protein n=1 Tax=Legionella lansingensis TaxID=45067 RepID=A0A0W0VRB5_9GAMM|nr:VWA domain-containing protein [Legionella lansingensis]KTD22738.1 hypothetical protein Llan_1089 [Legionella lansingensis]SNV56737.1 TPR (repeat) domain protein [Legionella lansingensis]
MTDLHFIRPWWLLCLLPLLFLAWYLWRQKPQANAWTAVCDKHLLERLLQFKGQNKRHSALLILLSSALFMVIALSGPSWTRLPVPTYKQIQPRVLILDMSDAMLAKDLLPNRLSRAKFKLHDLFKRRDAGQFALVVYSGEPFVVSPLTDDAQTIDALLPALTPDIMPVEGQRLDAALEEAGLLLKQGGFNHGKILVLTAETPSNAAINTAGQLAKKQIFTSVMPVKDNKDMHPLFQKLAKAGQGRLLFMNDDKDLDQWLRSDINANQFLRNQQDDFPAWRDEGRWFLIPALILLLPAFRRGWLQRFKP